MKKLVLKKRKTNEAVRRIGYKIAYEAELNPAQYEAVMHNNGAALVIAGAGTGKTRTLVYRVSRLIEDGVPPETILLLTFTRKAATEMLRRASQLLDGRCEKVSGGTFHSFAMNLLKQYSQHIGFSSNFGVIDQSDAEDIMNLIRTNLGLHKNKKRFPKKQTLMKIHSMSINKQDTLDSLIEADYPLFLDFKDEIKTIFEEYAKYKKNYNIMDYDDLLLNLHKLLKEKPEIKKIVNSIYKYIMVDEYQDTNRLQHEIVLLLTNEKNNVMAVGDDAQSIYSFRGADFQNIMFYPKSFSDCKIYKIEENYRSTQPILNLTNEIINRAAFKYEKELFTRRIAENLPALVCCGDERQQSEFICQQLLELREEGIELNDMAVLFRSAFHSFDLEVELNKSNIPFRKIGGLRFIETAHIKDLMAFLRVLANPKDAVSWQRILLLQDGIGPKTASKMIDQLMDSNLNKELTLPEAGKNKENIQDMFKNLNDIYKSKMSVSEKAEFLADFYKPMLKDSYDDWSKRQKDIESFVTIAERYTQLEEFINDITIDPPIESVAELLPESKEDEILTISTIHSAKGLEWKAVFLIWALEGRFPSARATEELDSIEEERRLFYVACTRAKDYLYISYPINIFDRTSGFVLSDPTRFLDEIGDDLLDKYILIDEEEE